ncbi:MAG TPA: SHOCT domain-containing protein [Bacilli bacterium]|nr:SHOCT domain-containing protein [Bacilli bacterium]
MSRIEFWKKKAWRYGVTAVVLGIGFYLVIGSSRDMVDTNGVWPPESKHPSTSAEESPLPDLSELAKQGGTDLLLGELRRRYEKGELSEDEFRQALFEARWAIVGMEQVDLNEHGVELPPLASGTSSDQQPVVTVRLWQLNKIADPQQWVLYADWTWHKIQGGVASYDLLSLDIDAEQLDYYSTSPADSYAWCASGSFPSVIFNLKDNHNSAVWIRLHQRKLFHPFDEQTPDTYALPPAEEQAYVGFRFAHTYEPDADNRDDFRLGGPRVEPVYGESTRPVGAEFSVVPHEGTDERVWLGSKYTLVPLR